MVIELTTAFAMRCPGCGRLEVDQVNIFQLSGREEITFQCECGTHKARIRLKGSSYVVLEYYCIICDREHSAVLTRKQFWNQKYLNAIYCLDTDLNLGYYGLYDLINQELERQQEELNSMANDLGFDEFVNPEIMLEVLDYLDDIAASGRLFCECGSHNINIELFSDRLELSCNNCYAYHQIPAASKEDLEAVKKLDEIKVNLSAGRTKSF